MATSAEQQLSLYLQDAHAIELQALEQVKRAPKIAGDPEIAAAFETHVRETERHRLYVEDRLLAMSWKPVPQKDITAKLSGVGMALFARFQPDTTGKLVAHASSYERMEFAAYDLIARLADRVGDSETAFIARLIEEDEREMAERLAACFDRAVDASLRDLEPRDVGEQLDKYLADAHAIEQQAAKLLQTAPKLAGAPELAQAFEEHLEETRHHSQLIEGRLHAREASASSLKDSALQLGALNLGLFMRMQTDTPAKLAAFAYAFEHLEIASYELLMRVATRAEDAETVAAADEILLQERAAAAGIHGLFDHALEASLHEAGVKA
jgi:ferritin-like metal-binding protein YciE